MNSLIKNLIKLIKIILVVVVIIVVVAVVMMKFFIGKKVHIIFKMIIII